MQLSWKVEYSNIFIHHRQCEVALHFTVISSIFVLWYILVYMYMVLNYHNLPLCLPILFTIISYHFLVVHTQNAGATVCGFTLKIMHKVHQVKYENCTDLAVPLINMAFARYVAATIDNINPYGLILSIYGFILSMIMLRTTREYLAT